MKTGKNGLGTDHELRERIDRALHDSGYQRLKRLTIDVDHGHVVLSGRVPSYYFKQVAQTLVLNSGRVESLRNDLDVV